MSPRPRTVLSASAAVVLLAGLVAALGAMRPAPQPEYAHLPRRLHDRLSRHAG